MEREYLNGTSDKAVFFKGYEVEKTPAYKKHTLFVTGLQRVDWIRGCIHGVEHVFFGANHSFTNAAELPQWEEMILPFLEKGYLCSLDIPVTLADSLVHSKLNTFNNFIPQLRVPVPNIKLWNYNAMLKIDDVDYNATNPGVWCHSIHNLMDRNVFTDWNSYTEDVLLT